MLKTLEKLCLLSGPSGNEDSVRNFILNEIKDYCEAKVDRNGNIICFKKGENRPTRKVMLDAHLDEVGVIITSVTDDGFLHFETVGGILTEALLGARLKIGETVGVIGVKPVHLCGNDERKNLPKADSLLIDIGAENKDEALKLISIGDIGTFDSDFTYLSKDIIRAKALDDRAGCAVIISLLKEKAMYDFYATFTVGEEVGLRGAKTAAYTVEPDCAIVLEATTSSDLQGTPEEKTVCKLGAGAAISFMDNATLYNQKLFKKALNTAKNNNISVQVKNAVAGGNNAGAIHLSNGGVNTLAVSLPCRYIHSPYSVACTADLESVLCLARELTSAFAKEDL